MKKPKAVKAWGISDTGKIMPFFIFEKKKEAAAWAKVRGINVIPVLITPITRKKK